MASMTSDTGDASSKQQQAQRKQKYLIVTIICGYNILRIFAIWKKSQN